MQKFLAFGVSPENLACGTEFRGSRAPAALPGEPFHLGVCLILSGWLLLSQDGNPMDTLGGETEFNLYLVLFADLQTRCFLPRSGLLLRRLSRGLAAGRADEAATKAPDI